MSKLFITQSSHNARAALRYDPVTYLLYVSHVADAEGDVVDVKLFVIERQLLCVAHHPRQT